MNPDSWKWFLEAFSKTTLARSGEQRLDEGVGIERTQILDALSDADVADRELHLVADPHDDAALRGPVELRQHDPGHADARVELLRLVQRVLPGRRVDDEQYLVRRAGN